MNCFIGSGTNWPQSEAAPQGVHLQVVKDKLEDDWLYIVVAPSQPGVRALDHANTMAKIERELRQKGKSHVLLVPTLEED